MCFALPVLIPTNRIFSISIVFYLVFRHFPWESVFCSFVQFEGRAFCSQLLLTLNFGVEGSRETTVVVRCFCCRSTRRLIVRRCRRRRFWLSTLRGRGLWLLRNPAHPPWSSIHFLVGGACHCAPGLIGGRATPLCIIPISEENESTIWGRVLPIFVWSSATLFNLKAWVSVFN